MNKLFAVVLLVGISSGSTIAQIDDPVTIGKHIVDRIINETSFSLTSEQQKPVLDIEVVDFSKMFRGKGIAYAASTIYSASDTLLQFGISRRSPLIVNVNGRQIFKQTTTPQFHFRETGYGMFEFNDTVKVFVHKGGNSIMLKTLVSDTNDYVYIRELTPPEEAASTTFAFHSPDDSDRTSPHWRLLGLIEGITDLDAELPPDNGFSSKYMIGNKQFTWKEPAVSLLRTVSIPEWAIYKREPYSEWSYPNGIMMWSILEFGKDIEDTAYVNFVKKYCRFTLDNLDLFVSQVKNDHAFRGFDYRIVRKSMLDDAGSPALPFAQLRVDEHSNQYDSLTDPMVHFVLSEETRLQDGTLCRVEPEPFTIWADDLFMSVPLLLRAAEYSGNTNYYDFAADQIIHFNNYLFDKSTGLFAHGHFVNQKKRSAVYWSRANGWIAWALSEALLHLPKTHKQYQAVLRIYQNHMNGLIRYQSNDGMWHQILTDSATFEETSSTAMFVTALLRGTKNGWIGQKYKQHAVRGWNALRRYITDDGIVKNICRGTGLSNSKEFYARRQTFLNDPRGMGAIITACREMARIRVK